MRQSWPSSKRSLVTAHGDELPGEKFRADRESELSTQKLELVAHVGWPLQCSQSIQGQRTQSQKTPHTHKVNHASVEKESAPTFGLS